MTNETNDLLKALININGRNAFKERDLIQIISPKGIQDKQIKAYNLCDGKNSQSDIVKMLKFDKSNFSKSILRWIEAGIIFRVDNDNGIKLLHIYPLSEATIKQLKKESKK